MILEIEFGVINILTEAEDLDKAIPEIYRERKAEGQGWKPVSRCG